MTCLALIRRRKWTRLYFGNSRARKESIRSPTASAKTVNSTCAGGSGVTLDGSRAATVTQDFGSAGASAAGASAADFSSVEAHSFEGAASVAGCDCASADGSPAGASAVSASPSAADPVAFGRGVLSRLSLSVAGEVNDRSSGRNLPSGRNPGRPGPSLLMRGGVTDQNQS